MNCDFSQKHYREILETALENNYKFISFSDDQKDFAPQNICILRHDIDYTPERAVRIGNIEKELGISSTFFFLINSAVYNLRDREVYNVVHQLKELGHHICLHYDLSWEEDSSWESVVEQLQKEKKIFELLTDITPEDIISIHNPHCYQERVLNQVVAGMPQTYEPRFFSEMKYLSDSQGWYEGCMCKVFASQKYPKIQLLTHPYIWPEKCRGDFIENMATMIHEKSNYLEKYCVKYHPVCAKEKDRLRSLI